MQVSLQGRKGAMFLHPMTVNFDKKELDSRYGVYHEVVKTSKVRIENIACVEHSCAAAAAAAVPPCLAFHMRAMRPTSTFWLQQSERTSQLARPALPRYTY